MVPYESSLERDLVYVLDFDITLKSIHSQPFTINCDLGDGFPPTYTPDFLATFEPLPSTSFDQFVYEVKYREDLWNDWEMYRPKFKAAIRYCRKFEMKFKIMTEIEIRTPFLTNATFLRRYRDYLVQEPFETLLLRAATILNPQECTPKNILLAAYANEENRMKAVGSLWRLLETKVFTFDYHQPLTMNTPLWFMEE